MTARLAPIAVAAVAVLTACGDTGIHSGTVVAKHHEDGYTYFTPVIVGKVTTLIPEVVPPKNVITVRDCSQRHKDDTCYQADIEDPANFASIHVGDDWSDR